MLVSLHDHLRAYTLRHLKALLLQQLLRDILRFVYAVFQDIVYKPFIAQISVFTVFKKFCVQKISLNLFILLLSKIRLKIVTSNSKGRKFSYLDQFYFRNIILRVR